MYIYIYIYINTTTTTNNNNIVHIHMASRPAGGSITRTFFEVSPPPEPTAYMTTYMT